MALARIKNWTDDEVLFAADLNAEFNNILTGALNLISPLTGTLDANNQTLSQFVVDAYTTAGLPSSPTAGRLARVTDGLRGLWTSAESQWYGLNGEVANVQAFGATGDGVTDDTAAIQAAIDAAPDGGAVFLPWSSSYYKTTSTLTIDKSLRFYGPSIGLGHASLRTAEAIDLLTVNPGASNTIVQIEHLYLYGGTNGINYTWTGYVNRHSTIRHVEFQGQTNAAIKSVTGMIGCEHGPINVEGDNVTAYGLWIEGDALLNATAFRSLRVAATTTEAVHLRQTTASLMGPVDFYSPIIESNYGKGLAIEAVQVNLFNPWFENNGRAGNGTTTLYPDIEITNNASGNFAKVEHFGGYYNTPNANQANLRIAILADRYIINFHGTRIQSTDVIDGNGFGSDGISAIGYFGTIARPAVQDFHAKAGVYGVDQGGFTQRVRTIEPQDATPSVGTPTLNGGNIFKTQNSLATTITTFDDGAVGQEILVIFTDANTTIAETGNIKLSAAFTSSADDTMRLIFDGTSWFEVSRSVN